MGFICSKIFAGSSLLGLSDVKIEKSERLAPIFPIIGRLKGSLSPLQPKTEITLPPLFISLIIFLAVLITFSSASGTTQEDFDFKGTGTDLTYTVPGNSSKTLYIYADTGDLEDNGDLVQITLDDAAADVTFGINGSGAYTEGDIIFRGDPAGPVLRYSTS